MWKKLLRKKKKKEKPANLEDIFKQMDEVKALVYLNLEKLLERDADIEHVEEMADLLNKNAELFEKTSNKLQWKAWFRYKVVGCCMCFLGLATVGGIAAAVYLKLWK